MTKSSTEWVFGDCHEIVIRIKKWKAGFSIKCTDPEERNTLVSTPYSDENFQFDLANFCLDCKKRIKPFEEKERERRYERIKPIMDELEKKLQFATNEGMKK